MKHAAFLAWGPPPVGLRKAAAALVGLVLLTAAVAKAHDPAPLSLTIAYILRWLGAPRFENWTYLILVGLVALELAVGGLLLLAWRPRPTIVFTAGFLLLVTVFLIKLALDPVAPACGCFGALKIAERAQTANWLAFLRNMLLLTVLVWVLLPPRTLNATSHHTIIS